MFVKKFKKAGRIAEDVKDGPLEHVVAGKEEEKKQRP
jgi:hypothetical protein